MFFYKNIVYHPSRQIDIFYSTKIKMSVQEYFTNSKAFFALNIFKKSFNALQRLDLRSLEEICLVNMSKIKILLRVSKSVIIVDAYFRLSLIN